MRIFKKMVLFLLLMLISSSVNAQEIAADNNNISYYGRWLLKDNTMQCGFGAVYLKLNFTGSSIKVRLDDSACRWKYSIDGGPEHKFTADSSGITTLADTLSSGDHQLFLTRITEGADTISNLKGFIIDDGAVLKEKPPMKQHRLEVVGDSISAGLFNDNRSAGNQLMQEDNDRAFGPQLARMLDADYSIIARSGEGVIHNYNESIYQSQKHIADHYPWTFYQGERSQINPLWRPERFPVDAVIIAIGTNDFQEGNPPPYRAFINGYKNLIRTIRMMNRSATIICTQPVPSCIGDTAGSWIKEAVHSFKADNGDANVYYIPLNDGQPLLSPDDYVGDNTHPTQSGAFKIALYLKEKITPVLKW